MTAPRIGIVGARIARQGLGPYVARDLHAAGVEVACLLGTSGRSVEEARAQLRERGVEARGYTDANRMLRRESLDALAILSPAETHERYLRAALEAGLHVLCEKPLVWGGADPARRAGEIVAKFRRAGLLLAENCQWPSVLGAFECLHPQVIGAGPRRFEMWLSPVSTGLQQLVDSLSHPLSLLQALVPGEAPRIGSAVCRRLRKPGPGIFIEFDFHSENSKVHSRVRLVQEDRYPRPAGFSIDGARAERRIRLPEYAMELSDGKRSVELVDPLTAHLREFARELGQACGGGPVVDPEPLAVRMALLEDLVEACRFALDERPVLPE